jgi:hypothetical protein
LTTFGSIKWLDSFRVLDHEIISAYKACDFETAMAAYDQSSEKQGDFLYLFNVASSAAPQITVSEDAGIEPAELLRRFLHWLSDALTTRLDLIHTRLDLIHNSASSHPQND